MTYDDWIQLVDRFFYTRFGLLHDDCEDFLWYDTWSDGASPQEAFNDFLMK